MVVHEGGGMVMSFGEPVGPPICEVCWRRRRGGRNWSENQIALGTSVTGPVHTSNWSALLLRSTLDK